MTPEVEPVIGTPLLGAYFLLGLGDTKRSNGSKTPGSDPASPVAVSKKLGLVRKYAFVKWIRRRANTHVLHHPLLL